MGSFYIRFQFVMSGIDDHIPQSFSAHVCIYESFHIIQLVEGSL